MIEIQLEQSRLHLEILDGFVDGLRRDPPCIKLRELVAAADSDTGLPNHAVVTRAEFSKGGSIADFLANCIVYTSSSSDYETIQRAATEMNTKATLTHEEWRTDGERRFGSDHDSWRFVCPACGRVASTRDWKNAGMAMGHIAYSCVSVGDHKTGCRYSEVGLFSHQSLSPVVILLGNGTSMPSFAFDDVDKENAPAAP